MAPQPPEHDRDSRGSAFGEGADDALRRLEERLGRASEAAERLIAEAAGTVGRAAESVGRAAGGSGGASGTPAASGASGDVSGASGDVSGASGEASGASGGATGDASGASGASGEASGGPGTSGAGSTRGGGPPPAGWQIPGLDGAGRSTDLEVLSQVFGTLGELIPPELQRRIADALRELLMAIRALIDWYLERTERKRAQPSEVQDIPIL